MLAPAPGLNSIASAVYKGEVAGYFGGGGVVLWPTPSSYVPLNTAGYGASFAFGIYGNQVAGSGFSNSDKLGHALLWNVSTGSVVDLTNFSGVLGLAGNAQVNATDGAQQVGIETPTLGLPTMPPTIAALWSGTRSSFVSLNPAGYDGCSATGVYNGIQVGYGSNTALGASQALMWFGSAASVRVLSNSAEAMGISRNEVVGTIWAQHPNTYYDAAMWGMNGGFVNLAPSGATASELFATNGTQQVGDVSFEGSPPDFIQLFDHHPAVWTGTALSFQLLPLPAGTDQGSAVSIDGDGDIAGECFAQHSPGVPVLWIPNRLAGDANFDGKVDFSDLLILTQHYGQPGEWVDGEFGGGGTVSFADLLTLAQNYGQIQAAVGYSVVAVPEPSAVLLVACGLGLVPRRRRSYSSRTSRDDLVRCQGGR